MQSINRIKDMSNEIGTVLRLTTFGESHGEAMGGVIDGFPARVAVDLERLQEQVSRRRPGQSAVTTQRSEQDRVEILSGIKDGMTLGTPIGFIVRNTDHRSEDYDEMAHVYRPSHADYTYEARYGIRDHRGGGRASARETVSRVVAGALAAQLLERHGVRVVAYSSQIGDVKVEEDYGRLNLNEVYNSDVRCPDGGAARRMRVAIEQARTERDTLGGIVTCVVTGLPAGVGDPVFGKLQARLAAAMMSIPAAKGFDYGLGFGFADRRGSEVIDEFVMRDGRVRTLTNYSGGLQGGITNGEDLVMRVCFKPIATMPREVRTVDASGNETVLTTRGRHDVCAVPRAVPVVEAMAALIVLDAMLVAGKIIIE